MAQLPTILNPLCVTVPGSGEAILAVDEISTASVVNRVVFRISFDNITYEEYEESVGSVSSGPLSYVFDSGITQETVLYWQIIAYNDTEDLTKISGVNDYGVYNRVDTRIVIGHTGKNYVIIASSYLDSTGVITPGLIDDSSSVIIADRYQDSNSVITPEELKDGDKVIIAEQFKDTKVVVVLTNIN